MLLGLLALTGLLALLGQPALMEANGIDGATGATGATGTKGINGATGATGATGYCTGAAGSSTIIPFASGVTPVALTSVLGGAIGTTSLIGFGSAVPGISLIGADIDLLGLINYSFSVPRAGNLTAISASFTTTVSLTILSPATVQARIYRAPSGSTLFSPTSALVNLTPAIPALAAIGTYRSGTATFAPIPVAAGDRLLMVFSITTTGFTLATVVTGSASAGLSIT